jgi:hypothetical protein
MTHFLPICTEDFMEIWLKTAWITLALVHTTPALAALSPAIMERLYGVAPSGELSVMLSHRGALFAAIVIGCMAAVFDPSARRAVALMVAVSVIGFLVLYMRAGAPAGKLRTIAIVDAAALAPLALVLWSAWGS